MTNTTNSQELCQRIEHLVEEYILATRVAARAAVDRACVFRADSGARSDRIRGLIPG
jgi:hypothetical protein